MSVLRILAGLALLVLPACVPVEEQYAPRPTVTAKEALAIAHSYRYHQWTAEKKNVFHGKDRNGVRVDTPDISLKKGRAPRPGWWKPGQVNTGIPYQWGGFDTPESFDRKLKEGYYAGDVYTPQKRKGLHKAVSQQACGIDCSGLISRCWRLDRAYSTRELPSLCTKLSSFDELKPGDIINKNNVHAILFVKFTDEKKDAVYAYETGSPPTWKVLYYKVSLPYLKERGYVPYRYKNMIEE